MNENIFSVIEHRRSHRTYSGLLPSAETIRRIKEIAATPLPRPMLRLLPEGTPLPDIRIIQTDPSTPPPSTYGFIKGARMYAAMGTTDISNRASAVAGGMLFERFVLNATAMDIATCWLGGTFSKSAFQKLYEEAGGEGTVTITSPVGHPAPNMRFGERVMRAIVKASARKPFHKLFIIKPETATIAEIKDIHGKITKIFNCIRLAPSSSNSQPWRAVAEISAPDHAMIALTCESPDNRFAPTDIGIALCHLFESADSLEMRLTPASADFEKLKFEFSVDCMNIPR